MLECCNPDKSLLFFMAFDLSEVCMRLDQSCQTNVHSDFKTQSPSEVLWLVQCYLGFFWKMGHLQNDLMTTGEGLRKCGGFAADDSVAWLRVVGVAEWGSHPQGVSLTKRQTSWGSHFWNFDRSWSCELHVEWGWVDLVVLLCYCNYGLVDSPKKLTQVAIPCFDHLEIYPFFPSDFARLAQQLPRTQGFTSALQRARKVTWRWAPHVWKWG